VSISFDNFCNSVDLDPTRLPGLKRLEIVDDQRHLRIAGNHIFILARGPQAVTSNVEARAIELEANGINSGLSIGGHRANPGKRLRLQESSLLH